MIKDQSKVPKLIELLERIKAHRKQCDFWHMDIECNDCHEGFIGEIENEINSLMEVTK